MGLRWIVEEDTNGNGSCNVGEPVLQRFDAPTRLEITRSSSDADIGLNRWGAITGAWIGFTLVPQGKNLSDPAAKGVCVSSGGRCSRHFRSSLHSRLTPCKPCHPCAANAASP